MRRRVAELPNVAIRDEVAVSGLAGADGIVTGVVLDTGEEIGADVVVDCTGRGARSDRWLAALAFAAPEQLEVKVGVGYATRLYRRRPGDLPGDWQAVFTLPAPPQEKTYGGALPIEGDRWLVGLSGWHTDPPADVEQFERFAEELPYSAVSELMGRAEPLADPVVFRYPSSRRRLFENLATLPGGYVALGDAICSFNPIYGQGMTVAVFQASALGRVVDRHNGQSDASMVRDFYSAASKIVQTSWELALPNDFAYPETTGPRPRGVKFRNWYARQVEFASQIDNDIDRVWTAVRHLLAPAEVLLRPAFAVRVLRLARKRRRAGQGSPDL